MRDRSRARDLEQRGFELHEGDVLRPETLERAGRDVEVAYYLIHAMGRGARGDFPAREHAGAEAFARMAAREGITRMIYLGGLGEPHRATCAAATRPPGSSPSTARRSPISAHGRRCGSESYRRRATSSSGCRR